MLLIVGLGNPGMRYKNTYHNVGFMTVDAIAKRRKLRFKDSKCEALVAEGADMVLAKPQTYMNLSGEAVAKLVKKYGVDVETQLIVVYDDVDLELGKLRIRAEGSAGTHNGMRNIVGKLQTTKFMRLRIGTRTAALADGDVALIDFVLSKAGREEMEALSKSVSAAADALEELASGKDFERVQEKLNRNCKSPNC